MRRRSFWKKNDSVYSDVESVLPGFVPGRTAKAAAPHEFRLRNTNQNR
jgi:hypothetical protein